MPGGTQPEGLRSSRSQSARLLPKCVLAGQHHFAVLGKQGLGTW